MPQIRPTSCGHNAPGQLQPTAITPSTCRQCGATLYAGASGSINAHYPGDTLPANVAATKALAVPVLRAGTSHV
jgi:hypothetical protein